LALHSEGFVFQFSNPLSDRIGNHIGMESVLAHFSQQFIHNQVIWA